MVRIAPTLADEENVMMLEFDRQAIILQFKTV